MVKYKLKALIADKEFAEDRKITYRVISEETGISKTTLSKISTLKGYSVGADIVEKLCLYFQCTPNDFMTIIPDSPDETVGDV